MSSTALEVPVKFQIVRNGVVEEVRRRRLVNPSFEVVEKVVKELARGRYRIEYVDDDGDFVTMDTEEEWEECICLWKQVDALRVRINLLSSSPGRCHRGGRRGPSACWWNGFQKPEECGEEKKEETETQPRQQPHDPWQDAARWWFAAMKNAKQTRCHHPRRYYNTEESVVVGETCKSCQTLKTTGLADGHCCWKCKWTEGAYHGPHCQRQKQSTHCSQEEKNNNSNNNITNSLELVKKVFDQLFGNGEEVLSCILEGKTDEKTLGCHRWLKITKLDNGDADLDVNMAALSRALMQNGYRAIRENNKKTAVQLFELCTQLSAEGRVWYNLACAKLMGHSEATCEQPEFKTEQEEALCALEKAVQLGFHRFRHMFFDPDLTAIRENPRFHALFPPKARKWMAWAATPPTADSADEEVLASPAQPTHSATEEHPAHSVTQEQPGHTASEQETGHSGTEQQQTEQQPEPKAEPELEPRYQQAVTQLRRMGFTSPNLETLVKQFDGDVHQVISAILEC